MAKLALPRSMTGIEISRHGGPEALIPTIVPVPRPGPSEILVAVVAAGICRPDVMQRQGTYASPAPPGTSPLPGREIAGQVVACGEGVSKWKVGDAITALVSGGGYAEYCVAHESHALRIPTGYDMVRAAALPETHFTVWTNLFDRGELASGDTLLVHGGASGIGTTAIQLAASLGARVFTTVRGHEKVRACIALGAELAIDSSCQDFVDIVKSATHGRGVDVVLDMVGGDYVARNILALAVDGRLIQISFIGGSELKLDLMPMMAKRLTLTGSTLRGRSVADKGSIAHKLLDRVWPLLDAGTIAPVISATFPLAQASEAHRLMETNSHIGKIVLFVPREDSDLGTAPYHDQFSMSVLASARQNYPKVKIKEQ